MKEYKHPNGYSAKLYGKSSMSIFFEGKEVLHTGFRNVNTEAEVMKVLENQPQIKALADAVMKGYKKAMNSLIID